MRTRFLLGCHQPGWLRTAGVPLFISDTRLRDYRNLPRAIAPWALDSGGFTQLQQHGRWTIPAGDYIARVRRYRDEIGQLDWAAPQDWMAEPIIRTGGRLGTQRFAGTGLTVAEHQRRTVRNFVELRDRAPDLPFIPVIQGHTKRDYLACVEMYERAGIDLATERLVGVGSVCRRQATTDVHTIIEALHQKGLTRLHGYGVKTNGLRRYGHLLHSADSMAWSYSARREGRTTCGSTRHSSCANCLTYALRWRSRVLQQLGPAQSVPNEIRSAA
ncbi:hypothetical protein NLX83_15815 [Allokutzneria sp. A3M-2-11 16]|uniref:deazapurine DNA modification protein DpdA family protein n=1 Tax=Allokutzneria sp. A3M-2-11 16 TaxID=2962043 RepID=UPI0020B7D648|nr:hypothetical protein [Allokutzneria sp. A3M-2-11 16]MCP3800734.1 hypothetical protein [Allokutzneria sp. A3M-2-11 16]